MIGCLNTEERLPLALLVGHLLSGNWHTILALAAQIQRLLKEWSAGRAIVPPDGPAMVAGTDIHEDAKKTTERKEDPEPKRAEMKDEPDAKKTESREEHDARKTEPRDKQDAKRAETRGEQDTKRAERRQEQDMEDIGDHPRGSMIMTRSTMTAHRERGVATRPITTDIMDGKRERP